MRGMTARREADGIGESADLATLLVGGRRDATRRDAGSKNCLPPHYVVFFELSRDTKRKRRLVLKVQSAYLKEPFDPALSKGRKVSLAKLLKATFLRHRLRA